MHPSVTEEEKELRAKFANIEKYNASAKSTQTRGRNKKSTSFTEKRVIALEAESKEAQDTQIRSIDEVEKSRKRATDAATKLAESVRRLTECEESGKLVTKKWADMGLQVARSAETADDALRRLADSSRLVELLEKEAQGMKSQLRKTVMARDLAVAKQSNRHREVKALEAPELMLGVEMDLLERREATNSDLEVKACNVADAQGDNSDMVTGLHQETVMLYNSICGGLDEAFVEVSRRLKEAIDREAQSLQQSVRDVVRGAEEQTRGSFANAPVSIDKRLELIVGRAAATGESAEPKAPSSYIASRDALAGASREPPNSNHGAQKVGPLNAKPNLPRSPRFS